MMWNEMKMKDLLKNWDLGKINIMSHQSNILTFISEGDAFYLKRRKRTSLCERLEEYLITQYLVGNGIPVETPLLTKQGEVSIVTGGSCYSLYASLEGTSIPKSSMITSDQFFLLGKYLAGLHLTLEKYPHKKDTVLWDVYGNMKSWLSIPNPDLNAWAGRVYGEIEPYERVYNQLTLQLVHSDVHLGNFLWHENVISGLVDFEKIREASRVGDIAYMITSILRDTSRKVDSSLFIEKIHLFLKGYSIKQPLSDTEIRSIPPLVILFLLQYTLYYSRQGLDQTVEWCVKKVDDLIADKKYLALLTDF